MGSPGGEAHRGGHRRQEGGAQGRRHRAREALSALIREGSDTWRSDTDSNTSATASAAYSAGTDHTYTWGIQGSTDAGGVQCCPGRIGSRPTHTRSPPRL